MRVVTLVVWALVAAQGTAPQPQAAVSVRAWSSTAGPDGILWYLEMPASGSARVSSGGVGRPSQERRFDVSPAARAAVIEAVLESRFLELPQSVGPTDIPLHGPENCLEVELNGHVRKVFLNDPEMAEGVEVSRFKKAWEAVVALCPLRPPL